VKEREEFETPAMKMCCATGLLCLAGFLLWANVPERAAARQGPAAKETPQGLLDRAERAEPAEARLLLRKVVELLRKEAPPNQADLGRKFGELLQRNARVPADVTEVLGPPERIARQVLYRRYREQWLYDAPVPLVAVFDVATGDTPRILTVRPARILLP
jgi:hypothetical protein